MQESVAKVANNIVDALRNQPMVMAILVFNALIFIFVFYSVHDRRQQDHVIMKQLIDDQTEVRKLLFQCLPNSR